MLLTSMINASITRADPEKAFAITGEENLSYGTLSRAMEKISNWVQTVGLTQGDRVAIVSRNEQATMTLFLSFLRLGITAVIGNNQAKAEEIKALVTNASAHAAFVDDDLLPTTELEGLLAKTKLAVSLPANKANWLAFSNELSGTAKPTTEISSDTTALIVFTSGTTARPKGVELSHAALAAQLEAYRNTLHFEPKSHLLNLLPLHHVDGIIRGPLSTLAFQATLHRPFRFLPQKIPALLSYIEDQKITHFVAVPTILSLIDRFAGTQENAFNHSAFNCIISSADYLDLSLWQKFQDRFQTKIINTYGLSEVVCDALFAIPESSNAIGTLGKAHGCQIKLVDNNGAEVPPGETGEICISGATVMKGYFQQPDETAAVLKNGWFHTGDLAYMNENGLVVFAGRKKTLIVCGGVNIHPENISSCIRTLKGVGDAITFGLTDDTWGERAVSCVVPDGNVELTQDAILRHCQTKLPTGKQPTEVHLVKELPRTSVGKIILSEVKQLVSENKAEAASPAKPLSEESLLDQIISVAAKCFKISADQLSSESNPFNTEGWDSLAHLNFITALEEHFNVQMAAEDILELNSIADAEEIIYDLLNP